MPRADQYLQHAIEAERQAERAPDSDAKEGLLEIARQWRELAAVEAHGQIYTSTDSGVTWTARESARFGAISHHRPTARTLPPRSPVARFTPPLTAA